MKKLLYRIRKHLAILLSLALVAGLLPLSGITPMATRAYEDQEINKVLELQMELNDDIDDEEVGENESSESLHCLSIESEGFIQTMGIYGDGLDEDDVDNNECDAPITVWEIYYKSGDGEPVRPTVYHHGPWGDDGSWIIDFSIPSSIDTSKPFVLVPDMSDDLEVLGDMTVTFAEGVGKGFFTLLAPDGRSTNYEITVKQPANNSTKLFWVNGENEVEISCMSNWDRYSEVTIALHKDTDHNATVWGIAYAEDADATIIGENGFQNGENGSHHFDITLNEGRGMYEIEVIAADGVTKRIYTIYFVVDGLERKIPYLNQDSLVIMTNIGSVDVFKVTENPYNEYEEHGFSRGEIEAWVSPDTDNIISITADIAGGGQLELYGWHEIDEVTGEWVFKENSDFPIKLNGGHGGFYHIVMRTSVPGDRGNFVHYDVYIHRENEFHGADIAEVRYKVGDGDSIQVHHNHHWGPDSEGLYRISFVIPSSIDTSKKIDLDLVFHNNSKIDGDTTITFVDGVGTCSFNILTAGGRNLKYEVTITHSTKSNTNLTWVNGESEVGHTCMSNWERYSEVTVYLHEDTDHSATVWGIAYAEDADATIIGESGFQNGENGTHHFDITLNEGRGMYEIEVIAADGITKRSYMIHFVVEGFGSDIPFIDFNSLVIMTNTGQLSFDDFEIIEDPLGEYPDVIRFGIKAYVSYDTDVITAITANVTNGGELSIDQLFNSTHQGPGVILPILLDEGGNHIDLATSVPGDRNNFVAYCIDIYRESEWDLSDTKYREIYYQIDDEEPLIGRGSRWWQFWYPNPDGPSIVEYVLPSSITDYETIRLTVTPNYKHATVEIENDGLISFCDDCIGKVNFIITAADGITKHNYEVHVQISTADNVKPCLPYTHISWANMEDPETDLAGWGNISIPYTGLIGYSIFEHVDPNALLSMRFYAVDGAASVKSGDGDWIPSGGWFDVQLTNGRGKAEFTIRSANEEKEEIYTLYFTHHDFITDGVPKLKSIEIEGNTKVLDFHTEFEEEFGEGYYTFAYRSRYTTTVPYETDLITAIDITKDNNIDYIIMVWDNKEQKKVYISNTDMPVNLSVGDNYVYVFSWFKEEMLHNSEYTFHIYREPQVFDLENDFGDGTVKDEDIIDTEAFEDAVKDALKNLGEDETVLLIDLNDIKTDGTALSDDILDILRRINEGRDEGDEIIEVQIVVRDDLTISFDPRTIPENAPAVDLNFGIIPVTQGTQFRNEDTNTKVTVPANSIIIAPPTHGEYGFEISFVITKAQWEEMGLRGSGKNFKLYYLNKDGIPVLADDEDVNARMEFDEDNDTITIFISGASIYILIDETDEDLTPEEIISKSPGNNNQNNQNNQKPSQPSNRGTAPASKPPVAPRPDFGSGATSNWSNLGKDLATKLTTGTAFNHVVNTGTDVVVPLQIINTLRGTKGTVMFNTGTGVTFSISGGNISNTFNAGKIDLSLSKTGLKAPASKVTAVKSGSIASIDIPMANREKFGMPVGIHFNFGAVNSGNYANLFRFNESSGEFEYLGSFLINDKGQAMFGISGGADYVVTVTKTKPNLPIVASLDSATYIVRPGDTLSGIAARFGMNLRQLLSLNPQISNPNRIRVGQVIKLQ